MSYASLGEFLAELQDHGELIRIATSVDSALELAAITDRFVKSSTDGGPALLFENVKNTTIPIVTNLLGSKRQLCRCLGVADLDAVSSSLDQRMQPDLTTGWLGAFRGISDAGTLGKWGPKTIKTGSCQQVVYLGRDVNLWDLPVPRCWPDESFPAITSGQIVTRDPATGGTLYFQSPLLVTGQQELAWYDWDRGQSELLKAAVQSQKNIPVAITLGGDPVMHLASAVPGIEDAWSFAGLLRGANLELVRCRSNDLEVAAGAEFVIEGYVDAANPRSKTTLSVARGNGRYVRRELPLIQVTAVTHRANPVFPAMVVSSPPSEESWIARAAERIFLPMLRRRFPEIVDIHQPFCGANRNLLFVSMRKSIDHAARRLIHGLWGTETMGKSKMIVIVDSDQDLRQTDQVWFRVGAYACPQQDFIYADGLARDDDYTPLAHSLSGRIGIDATRKQNEERPSPWPQSLKMSDDIEAEIQRRWTDFRLDIRKNNEG